MLKPKEAGGSAVLVVQKTPESDLFNLIDLGICVSVGVI
jgi:hypothetical protein